MSETLNLSMERIKEVQRFAYLTSRRTQDALTEDEQAEWEQFMQKEKEYAAWWAALQNNELMLPLIADYREYEASGDSMFQKIITPLKSARPAHRVHFLKTAWVRYAAAIIILFGIGAYLWNTQKEKPLITQTKPVPVKNDVAPGSTKAILTLSDGRKVELTPETGNITETGTNIQNANGRLEYGKAEKVVFNTMSTPRGGQYQLTLPDGTNVWLNAASSITYPTAFVNNTREVTITGEAYFEVKTNPAKPFVVKTPKENITVLGTEFNVNVYPDEKNSKTSLLEGAVKVGAQVLKPGQAYIDGRVVVTNVQQDLAWKNGAFHFTGMDIEAVFRQLSRWYSVEVKFAGVVPRTKVKGRVGRDLKLSQVLKVFSDVDIQTKIEGNTLIVLPE